ncbi:ABC transporter permease [Prochlorothrix hollandica]|uniref:ABC transporter substrate-binding protein n=1 Tax=Prochlorothrix hollandica PCC 9006 = CALU 1027 TaxID=317619 RepID=A0A0M2PTM4_PROHO|nr:ABC transporter permease [Prochlorothrix hollandica]KKI99840.1 ABC transporter substrate-binding protein [Prochlorothrix hollandica PCC 9006 = CALU 1027]
MKAWQRLKRNPLARLGAVILLIFYGAIVGAEFLAPYDPYLSEPESALLPPTAIYWHDRQGQWTGPQIYPTRQGPLELDTGDRQLIVNWDQPAPLRLLVPGEPYKFWGLIPLRWHLLGTAPPETSTPEISTPETTTPETTTPEATAPAASTPATAKWHLLGTDDQGRDQLSRLLYGGRISLTIGLVGIAVSFPLGMLVGGVAGYFGGWIDTLLMRLVEVLMTIPSLYLLVALAAVLPPGLTSAQRFLLIVLITSFVGWASLARVIRGQVLAYKEQTYVQAARAMGATPFHIITRHLLPQTATYIITSATLSVPSFIVAESVLSLIGLGIQQPDPSWGNMLSVATNASIVVLQPWLIWPPALLIIITVLAYNLLGDGLRDALDPRSLERGDRPQ